MDYWIEQLKLQIYQIAEFGKKKKVDKKLCSQSPSVKQKEQSEQMKSRKKEMLEVQHLRMTNVFDQRYTTQSQELMELRSRDLANDSNWYVWRFYGGDTVATQVEKIRTLIKELNDKLDKQGATLCKRNLNDWVFEYSENKQALLHNIDLMFGPHERRKAKTAQTMCD